MRQGDVQDESNRCEKWLQRYRLVARRCTYSKCTLCGDLETYLSGRECSRLVSDQWSVEFHQPCVFGNGWYYSTVGHL